MSNPQKRSLKLPLFLIIGPAAGLILAIMLYAVINFIVASTAPDLSSSSQQNLYGDNGSLFRIISNVVLFLIGATSMMAFVPCLVIGIIMLSKRPTASANGVLSQHGQSRDWKDLQ